MPLETGCYRHGGIAVRDLDVMGFGPFFERQLRPDAGGAVVPARVVAEHRSAYDVWGEAGEGSAQLAGRLRQELEETGFPGVGDWVLLDGPPGPGRTAVVERILERRTVFTRGAAGREARLQVVAANVDLVFAVCGLDEDFNVHRIERYVARVWSSGAQPAVILNKADVSGDVAARVAEVEGRCAGVPVLVTSALRAEGVEGVRALLAPGRPSPSSARREPASRRSSTRCSARSGWPPARSGRATVAAATSRPTASSS